MNTWYPAYVQVVAGASTSLVDSDYPE